MEINPYGLSKLDLSKLFAYMDEKNEKINTIIYNDYHKVMKFKYFDEFLNVINFSILFYKLNVNMVFKSKMVYSKALFLLLELSTLFFLLSVFLIYNKNNFRNKIHNDNCFYFSDVIQIYFLSKWDSNINS